MYYLQKYFKMKNETMNTCYPLTVLRDINFPFEDSCVSLFYPIPFSGVSMILIIILLYEDTPK